MSRSHALWFLGIAVFAACVACTRVSPTEPSSKQVAPDEQETPPPQAPAEDLQTLAEGNNHFAIDLYKKLANKAGNIVISPYSIRTALGMTYAGARGETAAEMAKVLHLTLPPEKLHPAFGATAHQLKGGKEKLFQLNVANALWGQRGFPFRPEFLELNRTNYAGGFRELDFATDPQAARQTINRWVEQKTEDRIKELLKPEDINRNVRLVLTNAIYFNGTWVEPFRKNATHEGDFETAPGVKMKVPMMRVGGRFLYHSGSEFELVMLPYRGDQFAMVVLLPRKRCDLAEVETSLTADKLLDGISKLTQHDGSVMLPRFKYNSRLELKEPLVALGMPRAFGDGVADFSGINSGPSLCIANVIHASNIEVDERGTEATAATAVVMQHVIALTPFQFHADQPFIYFLVDRRTMTIVFLGRYSGPG
jgi:serpin B